MANLTHRLLLSAATTRRRRRLAAAVIRAAAPLLPRVAPPRAPIFIVGSPRSGTTLLFEVLKRSPDLAFLPAESHLLGEMYHPDREAGTTTFELGAEDVRRNERVVLYWIIDRVSMGRRYLDKAPRNSLRIPYLHALYPDAWYLFLKRDGRAAISSLLNGWRSKDGTFTGMRMPRPLSIQGYEGQNWKFVIPRDWEAYTEGKTLAEVCAYQWGACIDAILEARTSITPDRWVEAGYEDLVRTPADEVTRILTELGVPVSPEVLRYAAEMDQHVFKAVTRPGPDKWRTENPEEIAQIEPSIADRLTRLGYLP